jgi:diaminopimelate decarboxylase
VLSPADPLAPEWLVVPDDANALAAGVWPASTERGADGEIVLGGLPVSEIVREYGTPVLVLDEDEVRARARAFHKAFAAATAQHGTTARVYYAGKAFLSTAVARWVTEEGLRVDVCTQGELEVALAAGVDAARIGFHGNNKLPSEIERAVSVGVGTIIVDSAIEIERVADTAARMGVVQRVLVRVNSGVHAETHDFLATAHEDQKFGMTFADAETAAARIRELPALELVGLHCHIGSQIFGVAGFRESASRVLELHEKLSADGELPVLNLGGGFGIAYTSVDDPTPISQLATEIVDAVAAGCAERGIPLPTLAFEPGRAIVGTAGVTLYEVGTTKPVSLDSGASIIGPAGVTLYEVGTVKPITVDDARRLYVSVDGGMSDNARPALYGAEFSARIASRASDAAPVLSRVVGRHCESGDIVVDHEYLPGDVAPGDVLAVPATGAYCASLASNYNHVPRPAVVAVSGGASRVIVRGETIEDLLARDAGISMNEGAR